jgi:hypothetical protein
MTGLGATKLGAKDLEDEGRPRAEQIALDYRGQGRPLMVDRPTTFWRT